MTNNVGESPSPGAWWTRIEFGVLAAGLIVATGLWGFVELSEVARDSVPHAFDTDILLAFREPGQPDNPIGPARLEGIMRDITALGSAAVLTLVTAIAFFYLLVARRITTAVFVLVAVGGGQILSSLLKLGIDRPRPELVSHLMDETTLSFPSGHAMMSAVTYLTLGALITRITPTQAQRAFVMGTAVLLTALIGVSRIYLGVHWPSDVLAGWCAGFAWAMLFWLAARLVARWRTKVNGSTPLIDG